MRDNKLRSGPIAKGMMATRIRKNTAPVEAPPPMRRAIRHSRRNRATAALLMRPTRSGAPSFNCLRVQAERRMRRRDDQAAAPPDARA